MKDNCIYINNTVKD